MPFLVKIFRLLPSDPLSFWQQIHPHPRYGFFMRAGSDPFLFFSCEEPKRIIRSDSSRSVLEKIGPFLEGGVLDAPRFVGCFNFNEGRYFDPGIRRLPKRPDPLNMPASFFGDYNHVAKIDFNNKTTTLFSRIANPSLVKKIESLLHHSEEHKTIKTVNPSLKKQLWQIPSMKEFGPLVEKTKTAIRKGDIYQANVSLRMESLFNGTPADLYRQLSQKNPSPYSCLLAADGAWIVSNSPELLLSVKKNIVVTRPIAGTRPRGKTPAEDRQRRGQLLLSPKERAEHIMLVDLERNDLGRVCVPGTVRVVDRYAIERYSHVMHIVSEVRGRLRKGLSSREAVKAVFPGGTITGCPKIKSIEIIENLENASRGIFYGSAGFFQDNGDALFNILIRTAFIKNRRLFIQAGAGIVADSHPRREYAEVLAKAQALRQAVDECKKAALTSK